MNISIRRLGPGDEAFAATVAAQFKSAHVSSQKVARFLGNPANYLIVGEAEDALAGFVLAYRLERLDQQPPQLFVYEVDVSPHLRGQSVGTRLMEHVRTLVLEEGLKEAFVFTSSSNAQAVALYRRTGGHVEDDAGVLFVYPGGTASAVRG